MSLWVIPALMSVGAAALAYVCTNLDRVVDDWQWAHRFLYSGTPDGTRTLLSTVAGSMITVAGVSFSVTMVALSLASSQLGPRLLVNFMRDRSNQLVLGGFIATFLYCLLSLGTTSDQSGHTVSASASVALLLASVSLLLLIYFIHHIASSMQADLVIQAVAKDIDRCLGSLFESGNDHSGLKDISTTDTSTAEICCVANGYLQRVGDKDLIKLAQKHDFRLKVLRRPGHYLTPGLPLVQVIGRESVGSEVANRILRSFIIGGSRTPEQDPEYGIFQLVEIALRALSPGINDPFTANTCIDHLSGLLASVADLPERPPVRVDTEGEPRLQLDEIVFEGIVEAAFNQIRQSSIGNAAVSIRLLEAFDRIAGVTPNSERCAALQKQADQLYESNRDHLAATDQRALDERYRKFCESVRGRTHPGT